MLKNKSGYNDSHAKSAKESRRLIHLAIGLKEPMTKINDIIAQEERDIKIQQEYVKTYGLNNEGIEKSLKRTIQISERTELQEPQTEKVVVKDNDTVLQIWNGNLSLADKAKQVIANFEANIKELQKRKEFLTNSLASFGVYLEQIAIVKFNDATPNYLQYLIKNAKSGGKLANSKRLEDQLRAYQEQFDSMKGDESTNVPSKIPTESDIENIITELNKMETNDVATIAGMGREDI
ncbi:hypothetical protein ACKAV7_010941 [Fusarium commune]